MYPLACTPLLVEIRRCSKKLSLVYMNQLTITTNSATVTAMSITTSRLIALFMLLWLPLSIGSALSASFAMQMQPGSCHESMVMSQHDNQAANTDTSAPCAACGVCLLVCHNFVVFQSNLDPLVTTTKQLIRFTLEIFISHVSAPLLHPPSTRA